MKGLLLKDSLILFRQMKIFFVILLIFAVVPNISTVGFAVVYSIMMPYTLIAYDERSKWNELAKMMPYSHRDLVFSKYLMSYIITASVAVISLISQTVSFFAGANAEYLQNVPALAIMIASSYILLSVIIPLIYKFGVEKSRYVFIFSIILICICVSFLGSVLPDLFVGSLVNPGYFLLPLAVIAVIANIVSIKISERLCFKN